VSEQCETRPVFLGIEIGLCGAEAVGEFTVACVHEHVKTRWLCDFHAEIPEGSICGDCWDGPQRHECPIALAPVKAKS